MAKIEAHRAPGLGTLIRAFGCFPVRRGESDREAVRTMRQVVADGLALGLFVEGTRQRSGVPGEVQAGRRDGRDPGGRAGDPGRDPRLADVEAAQLPSRLGRLGHADHASTDVPKGGKGYREASAIVQREIRRLLDLLVEMHEQGRPRGDAARLRAETAMSEPDDTGIVELPSRR